VVAFAPNAWARGAGDDLLRRMAWITVANSLTVSAQMALPDWVRARGMSIYQMALMGAPRSAPRSGARSPPDQHPPAWRSPR
jgi:hypothetical protein